MPRVMLPIHHVSHNGDKKEYRGQVGDYLYVVVSLCNLTTKPKRADIELYSHKAADTHDFVLLKQYSLTALGREDIYQLVSASLQQNNKKLAVFTILFEGHEPAPGITLNKPGNRFFECRVLVAQSVLVPP